jgi:putative phosphoribosyl transferase
MRYKDREEAARLLVEKLENFKDGNPLLLAIPRGAVPMAKLIADELGGEVDVVLVRKIGAPDNPEFAIGSVAESGWTYIADYAESVGAGREYIEAEKERQLAIMRQRRAQYTPVRPPIDPAGRLVIIVDDGLATGATMISALHAIRAQKPKLLVCAVPVSPPDTIDRVIRFADQVVCPQTPANFAAVGQFYMDFPQVSDEEVMRILRASAAAQKGLTR